MAQLKQMDEVIDAVLNHKKVGIIGTCNQYRYDAEKQIALEVWQAKLHNIITGTSTAKVLPFTKAASV